MTDLPKTVEIDAEGPREGFQFEQQFIPTARKIGLIEALAGTGLSHIQAVSFVNPKRVPGWADADQVIVGLRSRPRRRLHRAVAERKGTSARARHGDKLALAGSISMCASEPFMQRNQNRDFAENNRVQARQIACARSMACRSSRSR